jgi:hydrogenase maturation factor
MTEHKATPGQWNADRYDWARADTEALDGNSAFRCIMELRSRVEALENDRRAILDSGSRRRIGLDVAEPAVTRDRDETGDYVIVHDAFVTACSLVDELADVADPDDPLPWRGTCGLMLRQVAAWLREHGSTHQAGEHIAAVADLLEQEASR